MTSLCSQVIEQKGKLPGKDRERASKSVLNPEQSCLVEHMKSHPLHLKTEKIAHGVLESVHGSGELEEKSIVFILNGLEI